MRDIFLPLTSGAVLCIPDALPLPPEKILHWLQDEQITTFNIVPTLAQFWLDYAPVGFSLESLRWVFFVGEPLTDRLINQWHKNLYWRRKHCQLLRPNGNGFGEMLLPDRRGHSRWRSGLWGGHCHPHKPWFSPPNDHLCGVGEVGEIVIRTPFMTSWLPTDPNCGSKQFSSQPRSPPIRLTCFTILAISDGIIPLVFLRF